MASGYSVGHQKTATGLDDGNPETSIAMAKPAKHPGRNAKSSGMVPRVFIMRSIANHYVQSESSNLTKSIGSHFLIGKSTKISGIT